MTVRFRLFRWLCRVESRLNHPYWREFPNHPGTHWGPLSEKMCNVMDWLTGGYCHD